MGSWIEGADMKNSKTGFRKLLVFLMMGTLTYNGLGFASKFRTTFFSLNAEARTQHAKELLGVTYEGSAAQKFENPMFLGEAMQQDIYKNLPKKYKNSALELAAILAEESEKYQIDPIFLMAVIKTESSFNPLAKGSAGEIGLMQLKPDTAEWIAKKYDLPWKGPKTLEDPANNIRIGAAFFDWLRNKFDGEAVKYTSAYNMGAVKVMRMTASDRQPSIYANRVLKNYKKTYDTLSKVSVGKSLFAGN
jgi:soluble lytic murein transglycosylase